jgi:hypothetical protein
VIWGSISMIARINQADLVGSPSQRRKSLRCIRLPVVAPWFSRGLLR